MIYNLRVRRPGIEELDPFVYRFDPLMLEYGNPHLDLERTHNFSLSYMLNLQGWESGMTELTASISRSFKDDRWNIALTGTTGLGHCGDLVWTSYSKTPDFISTQSFTMPVQCITLGITYNFGGGKREPHEERDIELPQKRNRRGR